MRLIIACSATKSNKVAPWERVPFFELYDGPMWRQVRKAGFDTRGLAAISAKHGFVGPTDRIKPYDVKMNELIADRFARDTIELEAIASFCAGQHVTFFGGALYRSIGVAAQVKFPRSCRHLAFAEGSFLAQRKRLGEVLRSEV